MLAPKHVTESLNTVLDDLSVLKNTFPAVFSEVSNFIPHDFSCSIVLGHTESQTCEISVVKRTQRSSTAKQAAQMSPRIRAVMM